MSLQLTREQAQEIINSERDYQDQKYAGPLLHPSDGLRLVRAILSDTDAAWRKIHTGTPESLEIDLIAARKIAAVCQCLIETWGAPARSPHPRGMPLDLREEKHFNAPLV